MIPLFFKLKSLCFSYTFYLTFSDSNIHMTVPMWYYLTLVLIIAYNYDNKEYLNWFIYYVTFMMVEDWDDTLMCVYIKYLVLYWSKVYYLYDKYFKIYNMFKP